MSEMEKLGFAKQKKQRTSHPTTDVIGRGGGGGVRPAPRVELAQSDETFNLIARSLLNVSDQIPALVRDTAELKVNCAEILVEDAKTKNMIFQLANNLAALTSDIQYIASMVGAKGVDTPPNVSRMKLAADPGEEEMPSILRKLQSVAENGKK
jgi:hypothetical protein